jgi:hypothetical protein
VEVIDPMDTCVHSNLAYFWKGCMTFVFSSEHYICNRVNGAKNDSERKHDPFTW